MPCLVDVDVPRNPQLVEKVPLDPRQPLRRGATPKKKSLLLVGQGVAWPIKVKSLLFVLLVR